MEHEDQIDDILDGLSEEYKPLIEQIEGRATTPPSLSFMRSFFITRRSFHRLCLQQSSLSLQMWFIRRVTRTRTTTRIIVTPTTTTTLNQGQATTTCRGSSNHVVQDHTLESVKFVALKDMYPSVVHISRATKRSHSRHHLRHGSRELM